MRVCARAGACARAGVRVDSMIIIATLSKYS